MIAATVNTQMAGTAHVLMQKANGARIGVLTARANTGENEMNRAERRRLEKQKHKEPVMMVKRSELLEIKGQIAKVKKEMEANPPEKAQEEAVDTAIVLLMSLPVKVLHDSFGWGRKRLGAFSEALTEAYQDFSDGNLQLEDLQQLVFDQCGIKFQKEE